MVAVQASLLGAGSLEPRIVRQLGRRSTLARRYLAVEGHRALAANEFLPPVVRSLVDREVASGVGGAEESLGIAYGRRAINDPPASFGAIRPRRLLASTERTEAAARVSDPAHGAPQAEAGPQLDEDDADDANGRRAGHLPSSPGGGRGALERLLERVLGATREPGAGGPAGAGAPTHVGRALSRRPRQHDAVQSRCGDRRRGGGVRAAGQDLPRVGRAPDALPARLVHRPGARPASRSDLAPMAMPDGLALRRPLARLGMGLDRSHRQLQGDDIDVDAAVEARVELLAGSPPDEAVYVESLRRRRDLAVLILLDISGSAGEPGPAGRTVHEHQRSAAAALDHGPPRPRRPRGALRLQLAGSKRRARHAGQGFDDRLDSRVVRASAASLPGAYTRLGAAIRHGASVLEERGRDVPSAARRRLGRVRVRPRLRGRVRRGRRPAGARRGPPSRARLPVPQRRRGHRRRRPCGGCSARAAHATVPHARSSCPA